jgi:signal transduction histidine kinase
MLPTSHIGPMNSLTDHTPEALLVRFDEFIESANRLESSHLKLQDEVVRLRRELEERNEALQRSLSEVDSTRQLLLRILEALPCGVVLLDIAGSGTILANPEAQKLLWPTGKTGDELPEPLKHIMRAGFTGDAGPSREEEIFIEATCPPRWLSVQATHVSFSLQKPTARHCLLILQDISAEKELEREREQARNSLALAEMSSVLAHEIRNPLGAMELFLSLLRSQASLGSEALGWTDHLMAGVRNLSATVNNVLQFYATGSLEMSPIAVGPIIEESAEFLEPVATESSIQLQSHCELNGLRVVGDSQALRQVILNLCCNALRHSTAGGVVDISASNADRKIRIEVKDNGSGVAPEHLPHIFEAGFSASGRSSGLGLAVCKRIVEAHGGVLGVLRTSSQGTVMYLEIPAV